MASELLIAALILVLPFAFSLTVLSIVRKTEVFCREPWRWVLTTFIYGSTLAVFVSIVIGEGASVLLGLLGLSPILFTVASAAFIAPIVEESAKATCMLPVKSKLTELENGIIYGSAVGLGFSATENVIYFLNAYSIAGFEALISTIILRSMTSTFLHLSASGVAGYGIGLAYMRKLSEKPVSWAPFLLAAIGLHAFFNFLSFVPSLISEQLSAPITFVVFLVEVTLVWFIFTTLRRKITKLDRTSGCAIEGASSPPPDTANPTL
jgi:RsiW-degrading membrane proteinase PrsW (M82 family)